MQKLDEGGLEKKDLELKKTSLLEKEAAFWQIFQKNCLEKLKRDGQDSLLEKYSGDLSSKGLMLDRSGQESDFFPSDLIEKNSWNNLLEESQREFIGQFDNKKESFSEKLGEKEIKEVRAKVAQFKAILSSDKETLEKIRTALGLKNLKEESPSALAAKRIIEKIGEVMKETKGDVIDSLEKDKERTDQNKKRIEEVLGKVSRPLNKEQQEKIKNQINKAGELEEEVRKKSEQI